MRFYTKKGVIIGSILWGTVLFMIFSFFIFPCGLKGGEEYLTTGGIFAVVAAFIVWFWFGTYYEIGEEYIKIVSGPIKLRVQISAITSIKRTRNPLSSPASSLNRLEIKYGKWGFTLISPNDEERFCKILRQKNPNIRLNLEKFHSSHYLKYTLGLRQK